LIVAVLDKLHAKHVLPGFTDRSSEEREIERQTQDITRVSILALRVYSHIAELTV
jgi:syntaxin 16